MMMAMADAPGLNPNTIDLVGLTADGAVQLFIVRDSPWTGTDDEITALQGKIHNYVGYALDGQMHDDYPETAGAPWQVVVRSTASSLDARTAAVLAQVGTVIENYGGTLQITT